MIEYPNEEEQLTDDETAEDVVEGEEAVEDSDSEEVAEENSDQEPAEESEEVEAVSGPRLILKRTGEETDIVFGFSTPAIVGRFDPSIGPIDIDLGPLEEAGYISRKHAKIVEEEGAFKLIDMGSSNGTYVLRDDFEKVEEAEISDGDEIAFGNARFVFRV